MNKISALGALTLAALSFAAPAQAAGDDIIDQLTPGTGIPVAFGPEGIPGNGVNALGNWNANAGHVALQQVAQLAPSQHEVQGITSDGLGVGGALGGLLPKG
ncbi:hypothetical protein [Streptomyces sp. NRRL B-24572]|uniref:hypothetical protein n=1 Tax=Streptomyces sp. NRRL B-24572 TaxID=1962156 RepID=UPI000A37D841|nr:hypothetical protein [Streptomyces sp. NRRL B-24572]